MKLNLKVLSSAIAGVMTVMSFGGVIPKQIFNTGNEMVVSAATFVPRETEPSLSDPNYTSDNVFYKSDCGMPNCTCYAYGRAKELLGTEPSLCHGWAYEWYDYNDGYARGSEPKLGAIACWYGHVAVVEGIDGDTVWLSESNYGGAYFNYFSWNKNNMSSYVASFQGYIYIGEWDSDNLDGYTKADLGNEFYASIYNSSLDVALSVDGSNAYGAKSNDGDEQLWKFVKQADGGYSITNKKSELSLDVSNYGTTGGTNIQLCEFSGNSAQHFYIYNAVDGYLIKPKCSNLVFDLETFNDCNLATYPLDENLVNKKFLIKKYYSDNKLADFGDEFDANIYNSKLNLYLTANGFNVSGEEESNQENQIWHFTKSSDGGYFIKNESSSLTMDVSNFGSENGTNIQLIDPVNNLAQLFYIYESHDGFLFRPACSDLVFDIESFNSYNLATYELDDYYDNKEFSIIKLTNEDLVLGDCNNDGIISTADIVTLKKWLLNIEGAEININAADFNQNGSVDILDFIMLKTQMLS